MGQVTKGDILKFNNPLDETSIYDPFAIVTRAKGSKIWLQDNQQPYLDLLMGYSSTNFGHANKQIIKFVKKAADKYDNVVAFNSSAKIELSKKLIKLLPFPQDKIVYYTVGGAKAIDTAIKLAKAYTKKDIIITFEGAFHGYTYAAMTVTDDGFINKTQFGTDDRNIKRFPFPNRALENSQQIAENILDEIERYLKDHYFNVAAVLFEPIQGAAGFIIPPKDFLSRLMAHTKKYNILTICDEIQTAIDRTGTFYFINQLDLNPDIILISKSLAGGYYPLSAIVASSKLYESVDHKHSGFDSTFSNNFFGLEIANFVVDYAQKEEILELVKNTGQYFFSQLKLLFEDFDFIKELDYIGMAYGFRAEARSKKVEDSVKLANRIKKEAFKNHLIIQTAGGYGDHIKLSPNFFISKKEIKIVIQRLNKILKNL